MTTPIRTCSHCGCTAENLIEFRDRLLCPDCLDSMTEVCVDCGTRFWQRECLTNDHGDPICPDCCDRNYTRCTRCGRPRSVYRKFGLCRVCLRELASKGELPGVTKASW